eukprot:GFKZ01013119.1.p1 GENE.GFKZ01013119.1~~GFKZ01013119.1.p1  ORF type:complete len:576 (-),score=128.13 GFKZ01013119.1:800-2527(-)
MTGLGAEGAGEGAEGRGEQISGGGDEGGEDAAGDGAAAALAGGMGATDDGGLDGEADVETDGGDAVAGAGTGDGSLGGLALEHDLLNGLPDHAVGGGSVRGAGEEGTVSDDRATGQGVRGEIERSLSALDRGIDSEDLGGEESEDETEGARMAVGDAAEEERDGGEEKDGGDEDVAADDEGDDDAAAGGDDGADESLEWDVPLQPVKDPNFNITMTNIEEVFGIKQANTTVLSNHMQMLLVNHDIRDDVEYQELEAAGNFSEFVAKYVPLVKRGSGSLLGGRSPSVFTDNLYVVRHSGDSKKGYGVYATAAIPADTILAEYGGELADLDYIESGQYAWETPEMLIRDPKNGSVMNVSLVIDATKVGNLMRFVNDLGEKYHNVEPYWVPVDNFWHLFYVTTKDIQAGEELSVSYGDSYWGDSPPEGHTKESSPNFDTAQTGQLRAGDVDTDKYEADEDEAADGEDDRIVQDQLLNFGQGIEDQTEFPELANADENGNGNHLADLDAHELRERDGLKRGEENSGMLKNPKLRATENGLRKVVLRKQYLTPEDVAARQRLASRNIPSGSLSVQEQVMT